MASENSVITGPSNGMALVQSQAITLNNNAFLSTGLLEANVK